MLDEYRAYLAPAVAILVSILLFLFFLLPQFFSLSEKRNNANSESKKLNELVEAKNIATSADQTQLAANISLVNSVLPSSKNFESIINALSTAAAESGTVIQDYQFQDNTALAGTKLKSFPSLSFTVNIFANPSQTMDFISKLYEKAPVSEVEQISQSESFSNLTISFFYRPFSPITDTSSIQISKMNSVQSNTLNTISQWNVSVFELGSFQNSTGSAEEDSSPF
jgi:hypothetical protein